MELSSEETKGGGHVRDSRSGDRIIFVYLLVSIMCTAIREGIEAWFKTRAAYLEHGVRQLLHDQEGNGLATAFYRHPLIFSLFSADYRPGRSAKRPGLLASGANLPSYIPAKNFALTLMDIAARGPATDVVSSSPNAPVLSVDAIRVNLANLQNASVQRLLLTMIDSAEGDLNRLQANIEAWYDSAMDRISGWYKRSTQWIIFWIALFVTVALNINTITIANYLYRNDAARALMVARAQTAADDTQFLDKNYKEAKADLEKMGLPIGWSATRAGLDPQTKAQPEVSKSLPEDAKTNPEKESETAGLSLPVWHGFFAPLLGWLLTAFAASMGAPFWFDMLNKVMVIRSTVKPHEKSPEEASEDRQTRHPVTESEGKKPEPPRAVGGPAIVGPNAQRWEATPTPRDADSAIDGCGAGANIANATPDEQLPETQGGVASA